MTTFFIRPARGGFEVGEAVARVLKGKPYICARKGARWVGSAEEAARIIDGAPAYPLHKLSHRKAVEAVLANGGWHTPSGIASLVGATGTSSITRRIREYRARGATIEKRRIEGASEYMYRLVEAPR